MMVLTKSSNNKRYITVEESLRNSIEEVNKIKEGKLKKPTLDDLFKIFEEEEVD